MALIKGKQLADSAISSAKLADSSITTAKIAAEAIIPSKMDLTSQTYDFSSATLQAGTPSNNTDVANKAYVDANAGGSVTINGTSNEIEVSSSGGTHTIGLPDNVTITGNLTVSGTTTTVNSTQVLITDKAMVLANGANDSQIASAGGAGLKMGDESSPVATLLYDGVDSFDVSDNVNLASGQAFKIANTTVLDADGATKVKSTVAGTGLAHSSGSLEVDISGLAAMSGQVDIDADVLPLYDATADSHLKITPQSLIENIFTDLSTSAVNINSSFLTYDSTSGQDVVKKSTLAAVTGGMLQAWTALGSSEITGGDNFLLYDADSAAPKEITFANLGTAFAEGNGLQWSTLSSNMYVDVSGLSGNGVASTSSKFNVKGFDNFDASPSSSVSVPGSGSTAISFGTAIPNYVGDVRVAINGIQVNSNAYAYTAGGSPALAWTSNAPYALETSDVVSITGLLV